MDLGSKSMKRRNCVREKVETLNLTHYNQHIRRGKKGPIKEQQHSKKQGPEVAHRETAMWYVASAAVIGCSRGGDEVS